MDAWERLKGRLYYAEQTQLLLDWEGMQITEEFLVQCTPMLQQAMDSMEVLERGGIANRSEQRMVGHYWLRAPHLAPTPALWQAIEQCLTDIRIFTAGVHSGQIAPQHSERFCHVLVAGIGGSNLGTVFLYDALLSRKPAMHLHFLDNTDPDGMDAVFEALRSAADETLCIVISKSGSTVETRNCMEETRRFYESCGLAFADHAVCISEAGSRLDRLAEREGWLARFPMWDWVGGRTSVLSAVGLLPLALAGANIDELLRGAAECDALTRSRTLTENPAAILTLCWYRCSEGRGGKTMVVLPYKNTLSLFARYLQQLIMESLGKEYDLQGRRVHQGLAVMGNKGSTDQHSYLQQLIAGPENVFVTFVQVLRSRRSASPIVGEDSTSGDYLNAFLLSTRKALEAHGKRTVTLAVPEVNAYYLGQLIALFERTVGLYAACIGINAYDQPAVEWGKRSADSLITLKNAARTFLCANPGRMYNAEQLSAALDAAPEDVFRLLLNLSENDPRITLYPSSPLYESRFMGS